MLEIYSLDFDGCIANLEFLAQTEKDIIQANKRLIEEINLSPNKKIVMIGSNRQAPRDDLANSNADGRGSCYPAIRKISDALNAVFDDFLLSDIYNDLSSGTSMAQAMKLLQENNKDYRVKSLDRSEHLYNWIHDESKLTLIYAQMHRISLAYPNERISFNFLDDRTDILRNLHAYFSKYPHLIPDNIVLNLAEYKGTNDKDGTPYKEIITKLPPIVGTGKVDSQYKNTVKNMAGVTIEQMTLKGLDIAASGFSRPIRSYDAAKKSQFNISAINCVKHYAPDMIQKNADSPPVAKKKKTKTEKSSFFGKKQNKSCPDIGTVSSPPQPQPALPTKTITPQQTWQPSSTAHLRIFKKYDDTVVTSSSSSESAEMPHKLKLASIPESTEPTSSESSDTPRSSVYPHLTRPRTNGDQPPAKL